MHRSTITAAAGSWAPALVPSGTNSVAAVPVAASSGVPFGGVALDIGTAVAATDGELCARGRGVTLASASASSLALGR